MAFTYLTLPQLAKLAGVRPDDIRFYIERGLLQGTTGRRSRRDDRGFRQEHLDRLRFIQRALAYGLSVDAIARFVDPYRMTTCNDVYRIAVAELEGASPGAWFRGSYGYAARRTGRSVCGHRRVKGLQYPGHSQRRRRDGRRAP